MTQKCFFFFNFWLNCFITPNIYNQNALCSHVCRLIEGKWMRTNFRKIDQDKTEFLHPNTVKKIFFLGLLTRIWEFVLLLAMFHVSKIWVHILTKHYAWKNKLVRNQNYVFIKSETLDGSVITSLKSWKMLVRHW